MKSKGFFSKKFDMGWTEIVAYIGAESLGFLPKGREPVRIINVNLKYTKKSQFSVQTVERINASGKIFVEASVFQW